jgi:D-inositol-3-phosphate glycosyltransferase
MKRYVILSPANPLRGGIASSSERLAEEIRDQGHEVDIVSFKKQYPDLLFPGKTQFTSDPPPRDIRIHSWIHSTNPFNWRIVANKIAKLNPDYVIVRYWIPFMGPSLGTICKRVKSRTGAKIVCLADNLIPHEQTPVDTILTRNFLKHIDSMVVMSKSVGQDLRKFSDTIPYTFVPHPIYDNYGEKTDRFEALDRLGLDNSKQYILFFGFIRNYKGLDILIDAFESFNDPNVDLIVAGEFYSDERLYKDDVENRGLSERIHFYSEYIPNEQVADFFASADIVAQPYKSATQSGISQLAYHFEKPMLVTNVGGLPEIVDHDRSGYVVDVDSNAVTLALKDFFSKKRYSSMVEETIKAKKRFSWTALFDALTN